MLKTLDEIEIDFQKLFKWLFKEEKQLKAILTKTENIDEVQLKFKIKQILTKKEYKTIIFLSHDFSADEVKNKLHLDDERLNLLVENVKKKILNKSFSD